MTQEPTLIVMMTPFQSLELFPTLEMNQEMCQEMSELNTNLSKEMHQQLHHNSIRGAPTPYSPSLK